MHCIVPFAGTDLLGSFLQGIARLPAADFVRVPRACLVENTHALEKARWLIFCTHPLREAENVEQPKMRPFLTYYAFSELVDGEMPIPLTQHGAGVDEEKGADAEMVHALICRLEQLALTDGIRALDDDDQIETAQKAGIVLQKWVESVTRFGAASFLEAEKYFVPIPVALMSVAD